MYDKASDLYYDLLATHFNEHNELSDAKRNTIKHKYDPKNIFLETYNFDIWFENEELSDTTIKNDKEVSVGLSDVSPLESDEEVK